MTIPFHTLPNAARQPDFGLVARAPQTMANQVRFSELDLPDHVNNSVYQQWFERLRVH